MKYTLLLFLLTLFCLSACNKPKQDSSTEYQLQIANNNTKYMVELRLNSLIRMKSDDARIGKLIQPEITIDSLIEEYIDDLGKKNSNLNYNTLMLFKRKIINVYADGFERSELIDSNITNYKQLDTVFTSAEVINLLLNLELQVVTNKHRQITYCGWDYIDQAIDIGDDKYLCIIQNNIDFREAEKLPLYVEVSVNNHFLPNYVYELEKMHHTFVVHINLHEFPIAPLDAVRVFLIINPENENKEIFLKYFTLTPYLDKAAL